MICRLLVPGALALLLACETSPLGRRQFIFVSDHQMAQMGFQAFEQMKQQMPQSRDWETNHAVRCVAEAITAEVHGSGVPRSWEVAVFKDTSANAFALPGGKIGVHTGILRVARTQHQLATVLGHEVAHVLAKHANERVSTSTLAQAGVDSVAAMAGGVTSPGQQQLFGLLGLGAQVGILLPFNRTQESEADMLGLDLMGRAGFDPRQSIPLWENMSRLGEGQPPEFLSTHPSHETRIHELEERLPTALSLYETARARGKRPGCW